MLGAIAEQLCRTGKSLREVRLGDGTSERKKFQDLARIIVKKATLSPRMKKEINAWGRGL